MQNLFQKFEWNLKFRQNCFEQSWSKKSQDGSKENPDHQDFGRKEPPGQISAPLLSTALGTALGIALGTALGTALCTVLCKTKDLSLEDCLYVDCVHTQDDDFFIKPYNCWCPLQSAMRQAYALTIAPLLTPIGIEVA